MSKMQDIFESLKERADRDITTGGSAVNVNCPGHDDRSASLSLSIDIKGKGLFYCHAGCNWTQIAAGLGLWAGDETGTGDNVVSLGIRNEVRRPRVQLVDPGGAEAWWCSRTQVPADFWKSLGTGFRDKEIVFGWQAVKTHKIRHLSGDKARYYHTRSRTGNLHL